ncbi:MAG: ATPase domain-containing protein [Euryarchaeota archaeon]|nr:ATPase domain-containing protein [Euryarchaeota archaeon]
MMERVPTGISGLDELTGGGFISGDVVLITGSPGCGKTTLGLQYLYRGAIDYKENGVFVTLEESPARVIRNTWQFGWDIERLVKENRMRIIRADPIAYSRCIPDRSDNKTPHIDLGSVMIETLSKQIEHHVNEIGAKRIFIDSITSLKISENEFQVRSAILELIKNLENLECTTILASEITPGASARETFNVEEYLSEVVIRMHMFRSSGNRVKAIEILKMRGAKHDEMMRPYAIIDSGLAIYPRETVIDGEIAGAVATL